MRRPSRPFTFKVLTATALILACADAGPDPEVEGPLAERGEEHDPHEDDYEELGPEHYLSPPPGYYTYDCTEKKDTGYVKGVPYEITVVTVDGKPVEVATADAYLAMRAAAAADGVGIKVVSGFRTNAEQQYLYNCYINCNCNNCNLAAKPGYSNHQSGHALDLNSSAAGVGAWLMANGAAFGFARTVPSEPWHWEWWGGGPPTEGPCGKPLFAADLLDQSFPAADHDPPIILYVGETRQGWVDLHNPGKATWSAVTYLAPQPHDQPSPLADPTWLAPNRVARVDADTPAGQDGRFTFTIRGNEAGDYTQNFALVDEQEDKVTWFADDLFTLRVLVLDQPTPAPEPEPEPEPQPQPEPDPEPQPEPDPEPQPDPDPEPQPEPDPTGGAEPGDAEQSCACSSAPLSARHLSPLLLALLALPRRRARPPRPR
ncbi:MAG: D-alanyl-D-alanine carboxypeptidase family protein [Nannocystis sp.]|nr:D-alanyl-D-alanine carboxypeptidase family protein [Nannocystis sp.]